MGTILRNDASVIITRTPLRVSFAGGGTDLAAFYEVDGGAVLSTAIDKYVHVTVKRHSVLFFEPIRLNYSRSEQVNAVDEIENRIARTCLQLREVEPPIYISVVGDVPASTGLGGSSAFTVGLLNALHALQGTRVSPGQLAEEACHVEIDLLQEPIGKQDQYAAAFGGLNLFRFHPGGGVSVQHQQASVQHLDPLLDSMMMFWTGHQRDANSVLSEQRENTGRKAESLLRMREMAEELHELLREQPVDVARFGKILDEGWHLKRGLASTITNPLIDHWYQRAMDAGAFGGKLCGAGGGGFLLFLVPPACRSSVRAALSDLVQMPAAHEVQGSQVVVPFAG